MRSFLDYFGLWLAINMIAWSTLWWSYDKSVTWAEEGHLLQQTSIGATAITLAIWGVTRAARAGSSVPRKYSRRVEASLDEVLKVAQEDQRRVFDHEVDDHVVDPAGVSVLPEPEGAVQDGRLGQGGRRGVGDAFDSAG